MVVEELIINHIICTCCPYFVNVMYQGIALRELFLKKKIVYILLKCYNELPLANNWRIAVELYKLVGRC